MSQHNFMRNLRMSMPQYITNVTSFKDAVRILKNKAILTESTPGRDVELYQKYLNDVTDAMKNGLTYAGAITKVAAKNEMDEDALATIVPEESVGNKAYADDYNELYEDDEEDEMDAIINKMGQEEEEEKAIKSGFGIYDPLKEAKKAKKELHPNQIHPQELRMGIKVELEHTDDLDKAKKIALDHLAENPYYYTALKLAGVESPSAPKVKPPVAFKKEVTAAVELVDKANAMKPVKGVEKIKASSNKAKKETNKIVKGVEELTHTAKSVRGVQKFATTGGKMKTIKLKEEIDPEIEGKPSQAYLDFLARKKQGNELMQATNADGVKFSVNDRAVAPDGKEIKITGFTTGKDGKMKAMYSAGMFADVYNLDDLKKKPSFRPGVDLGASFEKFKSTLEALVREVVNETFDGRDNLANITDDTK